MTNTELGIERWKHSIMNNYGTPAIVLERGQGARVWDVDGREYVDFLAGIAVNILGHAHPAIIEAVTKQLSTLGHVSNFAAHKPGLELAERLLALVGQPGKVFFCNSGAEVNETAIKIARLTGKTHIASLEHSFHGRTMGSLSVTGQPKKYEPFRPLLPGVTFSEPNDIEGLRAAITPETSAFWIEPIQGEGGVLPMTREFMQASREICTENKALFVVDEVQTGIARTGKWFAYQRSNVEPDILLLAKGLGGGVPIGACIALGEYADLQGQGTHGSTFGGNPMSSAAALAVLRVVEEDNLMDRALEIEKAFRSGLENAPGVIDVRGDGAMIGLKLAGDYAVAVEHRARELGVIVNAPNPEIIRLVPPLVITDEDLRVGIDRLAQALGDCAQS
jgi:acetylornithine aminotransferase